MKSKLLTVCLVIMIAGIQQAFPSEPENYVSVISNYIESQVSNNPKKLDMVLSDGAIFKIPRQEKVMVQTKYDLLNAMRKESGVVQNCNSSYQLIAKTDALILARVDLKYPGFMQHNYLTMERDGNEWKITQVCKISETNAAPVSGPFPVVTAVD